MGTTSEAAARYAFTALGLHGGSAYFATPDIARDNRFNRGCGRRAILQRGEYLEGGDQAESRQSGLSGRSPHLPPGIIGSRVRGTCDYRATWSAGRRIAEVPQRPVRPATGGPGDSGRNNAADSGCDHGSVWWCGASGISRGHRPQLCQALPQWGQILGLRPARRASKPTGKKMMETTMVQTGKPPRGVGLPHRGHETIMGCSFREHRIRCVFGCRRSR